MTNHDRSQQSQPGEIIPVPFPDFNAWEFMETLESLQKEEARLRLHLRRMKSVTFLDAVKTKGVSPQTAWQKVAIDEVVVETEDEYEEARIALRYQEESLKFIYKGLWQYGAPDNESDQTEDETE